MKNVFEDSNEKNAEVELVRAAQSGDRAALEELVTIHHPWVFNIALRMVGNPQDAEDVAQEIMVKIITRLSTFNGRSGLRTWLYRIVANHVLNMRRRPMERVLSSFENHARLLDVTLDGNSMPVDGNREPEPILVRETRQLCLMGMLLCLERSDRLTFVLGGVFGVNDRFGGEMLNMTSEAFRKKLSRARKRLLGFMQGRCGLLDPRADCRCPVKTRAAVAKGYIDPENLRFEKSYIGKVKDLVRQSHTAFEQDAVASCQELFRDSGFQAGKDPRALINSLLSKESIRRVIEFN